MTKPLFIHVPKTGGMYVKNIALKDQIDNYVHARCTSDDFVDKYCSHKWVKDLTRLDNFKEQVKFTVVRNPFDLLVSYMEYKWGKHLRSKIKHLPEKSVQELIEMYCDPNSDWHTPMLQHFLYWQLFDDSGKCRCDYAIIYDNLDDGLKEFAEKFGLTVKKDEKVNVSKREYSDYRDYYTPELRKMVEKKCEKELEMFNFGFDGYKGKESLIKISDLKIDWGLDPNQESKSKWYIKPKVSVPVLTKTNAEMLEEIRSRRRERMVVVK